MTEPRHGTHPQPGTEPQPGTDRGTGAVRGSGADPRPTAGTSRTRPLSRRDVLVGGVAASLAGVAGAALGALVPDPAPPSSEPPLHGTDVEPFYGVHQAGVETAPQAHANFVAFDLRDETGPGELERMFRLLSDDAARLTAGRPPLADQEPDLATTPARLTVTFAIGARLAQRAGVEVPDWLAPLPPFTIDRLESGWSDGDLLLQVCADDPVTVAHAVRMLTKDAAAFATIRWVQSGFRRAMGSEPAGTTMRNLFGQVDGTVNPARGSVDFDAVVWDQARQPSWLTGGTGLVVRRIAMHLDTWDEVDTPSREAAVGRRLSSGAPLTGTHEFDEPDFEARTPAGIPVISPLAHIRRARGDAGVQIARRVYNYDLPALAGSAADAGLIFASFQADPLRQFVPMQQRLDDGDLLNLWTTPIGSAVFAVLPGCAEGSFIGETLFG